MLASATVEAHQVLALVPLSIVMGNVVRTAFELSGLSPNEGNRRGLFSGLLVLLVPPDLPVSPLRLGPAPMGWLDRRSVLKAWGSKQ